MYGIFLCKNHHIGLGSTSWIYVIKLNILLVGSVYFDFKNNLSFLSLTHTISSNIVCDIIWYIHPQRRAHILKQILSPSTSVQGYSLHQSCWFWHIGPPARSPLVVSLSRIMKEPVLFPEARSCLSASFLLTPLKNHLQERGRQGRLHHAWSLITCMIL